MRSVFPGYYSLTDAEFDGVWESGLIVLDSSALLSLFRYSVPTSNQVIEALRQKSDQLWIPWHVGHEFHKNQDNVIRTQRDALDKIARAIEEAHSKTESAVREFKRHPSLATEDLMHVVKKNRKKLRKALEAARRRHDELVESPGANAATSKTISDLYADRVGKPWAEEDLEKLYKEGSLRFEKKMPPGYEDKKTKQEPEMYGDLVIWRQIIEHAKATDRSVLFVTDDVKEDWWWIVEGKRRGARPELVAEFVGQVGKPVAFVTPERLLDIARGRGVDVTNEAMQEVKANTQSATSISRTLDTLQRAATTLAENERRQMLSALETAGYGTTQPFRDWAASQSGRAALFSASEYIARKHAARDAHASESFTLTEALRRLADADRSEFADSDGYTDPEDPSTIDVQGAPEPDDDLRS